MQFTSSLLSNAILHPGLSTLLCNLVASRGAEHLPTFTPWAVEYSAGASREVYSLRLRHDFVGSTFVEAALKIFDETRGLVQLLGFQVRCYVLNLNAFDRDVVLPDTDCVPASRS